MAGPNEDWLVWDRRFQFGYSCLNQRLKTTEGATQQQLALLDQQIKEMAASNKHLQEDNSSLRDRIQQLEQTSDRTAQHDEQIQDLTASSGDLKGENNGLKDRMLQVEQEGIHRDQENQLVREQLKEELSALKTTVKCLGTSIKGMNEIARAERAQRGDEIRYLRSQVKDLVATKHTAEGYPRDTARDTSQATTEDEGTQHDMHAEQQQVAHQSSEAHGLLIKAQTSWTPLEDHLRYAETAFKQCETEAVLGLVSSVQKHYRVTLQNQLEKRGGWTWQAAMEEAYKMVEAEKTIKRRSARLMAGPSQRN